MEKPQPGKIFKPGSQNYRLYERLLRGPVTNAEIVRQLNIFNSTGRASDIRKALRPYLVDVEARPVTNGKDGLWIYRLTS